MSLNALERETVVTLNDAEDFAEISTAQRPWITKLKKNSAAELVAEGKHDGSVWATFRVPKELISVRSKRVKRELSAAQRSELAERMRAVRSGSP
jgi:hypothetical protein